MISEGCLCGAIRFEVARFVGPFELCHCSRCRKASGSAFSAMIGVRAEDVSRLMMTGSRLRQVYSTTIRAYDPIDISSLNAGARGMRSWTTCPNSQRAT